MIGAVVDGICQTDLGQIEDSICTEKGVMFYPGYMRY